MGRSSLARTPPGLEIFSLTTCEPISFLGLSSRRDYLGYLYNTLTYHILKNLSIDRQTDRQKR